jgi:hypothetical protein
MLEVFATNSSLTPGAGSLLREIVWAFRLRSIPLPPPRGAPWLKLRAWDIQINNKFFKVRLGFFYLFIFNPLYRNT